MAPKSAALLIALCLVLSAVAVHGCKPYFQQLPVVIPPPYHAGGGQECSIETLRLGVCTNVLGGVRLGVPLYEECCPLLEPLLDLDAAVCLYTAVMANILGIKLDVSIGITLLLNHCSKKCPANFTCQA